MGYINRINPTTVESGTVLCDSDSRGSLIGKSLYSFAGNPTGIAESQSVSANAMVLFNSSSLTNLGSVFPGQPVTLTITLTAATAGTLNIIGYNGHLSVTETLSFASGTSTLTSANSYTNINSIGLSVAVTAFTAGTSPLVTTTTFGVNQPQLAASLDVNSSAGALLYPKATQSQITNFDSTINGITYASTDGMRVYNTTTGSFCEKVNGCWSGLYLEDMLKPTCKKVSFYVDSTMLTMIGNNEKVQILPALPVYADSAAGLVGSYTAVINGSVNITGIMPYPAKVTVTKLSGTSEATFSVKGYYNGVLIAEILTASTTVGNAVSTINKFSSIASITCISTTGTQVVSFGYGTSTPVYVVHKAGVIFNGGSSGTSSGLGVLGLSQELAGSFIQLLSNAQVIGSLSHSILIQPSAIQSTGNALFLTNNNVIFVPHSNSTILVSVEYDIAW